ncbi:serine/threonine protein kinase [Sorochytrium milnesiophthora]
MAQHHVSGEEPFTPSGLMRIREEDEESHDNGESASKEVNQPGPPGLHSFADELHAFSFASPNSPAFSEARRLAMARSADIVRSKLAAQSELDKAAHASEIRPAGFRSSFSAVKHAAVPISIRTSGLQQPASPMSPGLNALHSPAKFTRSSKGVVVTDTLGRILVVNELLCMHTGYAQSYLVGRNVLDLLDLSYRDKHKAILAAMEKCQEPKEEILCSGRVLRVIRKDKSTTPVSLWLKTKFNEQGKLVLMWVFEEAKEYILCCQLTATGTIRAANGPWHDILGVTPDQAEGQLLSAIIPFLQHPEGTDSSTLFSTISDRKYFGAVSKTGATFPSVLKLDDPPTTDGSGATASLRILVMPNIAGVISILNDGTIKSCNSAVARYLLGYQAEDLVNKENLSKIIPQLQSILSEVRSRQELHKGLVSAGIVRKMAQNLVDFEMPMSPSISHISSLRRDTGAPEAPTFGTPASPSTPSSVSSSVIALHRDGTPLTVDVQIRPVKDPLSKNLAFVIWLTYDRDLHPAIVPRSSLGVAAGGAALKDGATAVRLPLLPTPVVPAVTGKSHKSIADYVVDSALGEGAYGVVKRCVRKDDPAKVAFRISSVCFSKHTPDDWLKQTPSIIKYIVKGKILLDSWVKSPVHGLIPLEIQILDYLRTRPHPNIVQMVDYFQDDDFYYLEMVPHGKGMDLFDYIEHNRNMAQSEMRSIFRQICSGIAHLHELGIVHRDIKDENIVLDEHCQIQIIDFGSSAYVKPGKLFDTFCGTIDYCAPEILLGQKYQGPPQDVWALGILFYVILFKECPFYNVDEIISRKLRISRTIPEATTSLLALLLQRDLAQRPEMKQVLQHKYFVE